VTKYDYVWKAYGENSIWNTYPYNNGEQEVFTLISYDQNKIVLFVESSNSTGRVELGGDFRYPVPPTAEGLAGVLGSPQDLRVYSGQTLIQEEQYPAHITMPLLVKGGYTLDMALITGNDYFAGSPLGHSDGIRGGDGNDTFKGNGARSGRDEFYGEAGTDTAIFRGRLGEYRIEWSDQIWDSRMRDGSNAAGYVVTDRSNARDDVTVLVEVERLQFLDVTLALDFDGVAGQAYRIYKAAFDRAPDLPGLGYWINAMDNGATLTGVAGGFIGSAEFQNRYGSVNDTDFIRLLYENVLDRQPDASGYEFWQGAMGRGLSREGVLVEFSESSENKSNVAGLIANGIQYTPFIS
jgi:hypothetical protein